MAHPPAERSTRRCGSASSPAWCWRSPHVARHPRRLAVRGPGRWRPSWSWPIEWAAARGAGRRPADAAAADRRRSRASACWSLTARERRHWPLRCLVAGAPLLVRRRWRVLARRAARCGSPAACSIVGLPALALVWLRSDPAAGARHLLWLLLVVWATDICAYLVGRAVGGPQAGAADQPGQDLGRPAAAAWSAPACAAALAALAARRRLWLCRRWSAPCLALVGQARRPVRIGAQAAGRASRTAAT